MQNKLTANEVAESLGNNEARIFAACESRGIDHQGSWYIGCVRLAEVLNK